MSLALTLLDDLAALPPAAAAAFGADAYASRGFLDTVLAHGQEPGWAPRLLLARRGDAVAIVPLRQRGRRWASLTTPYTCLWHPLAHGFEPEDWAALGTAVARRIGRGRLLLEALDPAAAWHTPFLAGLRAGGLRGAAFAQFGNWSEDLAASGWPAYLAARPGRLRETVRRRTRRLLAEGARFELVRGGEGLDAAIAAYLDVYARSWKAPEPFPGFVPAWMRACAADGSLRLSVLHHQGRPIAAQFWIVLGGWAGVQKLAHDRTLDALAPGTVLTGLTIAALLDEGVATLDFGRGDDTYKADWAGRRSQRSGLDLIAVSHPLAAVVLAKQASGSFLKKRTKKLSSLWPPGSSAGVFKVRVTGHLRRVTRKVFDVCHHRSSCRHASGRPG